MPMLFLLECWFLFEPNVVDECDFRIGIKPVFAHPAVVENCRPIVFTAVWTKAYGVFYFRVLGKISGTGKNDCTAGPTYLNACFCKLPACTKGLLIIHKNVGVIEIWRNE